jgi:hypothetical protein
MEEENINELLQALDNDGNDTIMGLTSRRIKSDKNDILQRLQITGKDLKLYHKKLKNYRYCSKIQDLRYGFYIRWIPLKNPNNIYLTNGGIICDMKAIKKHLHVICKNNYNQLMQIPFDESIIFQKLSDQERVILDILDYLNK